MVYLKAIFNEIIGTKKNVVYVDLIAAETIDESITRALQRKTDVAANVLGDLRA